MNFLKVIPYNFLKIIPYRVVIPVDFSTSICYISKPIISTKSHNIIN